METTKINTFFSNNLKHTFDKISRVKIFRSIEDGLSSIGNLLLFGSLFIIFLKLPQMLGVNYSIELSNQIDKMWLLTVGFMSLFFAGTVAKYFTESLNDKLKLDKRLDALTPMIVSMVSYLLLVITNVNTNGELSITINFNTFGLQGILTAIIVGIITSYIFYFIRKYLILSKKNSDIPTSFFDKIIIMIGVALTLTMFWGLGWIWSKYITNNINNLLDNNFSFWIRKYADEWYGLPILYGGYALSWFTGVHGPTVFAPLTNPINIANDYWNQQIFLGLEKGNYHIATWGADNFIACFGGTGATFVVPFLFMLFAKSKKLKEVGKMSVVSTTFGANEPLLFGTPIILNWYFFIPMLITPLFNVLLLKVFITVWGMRGFVTQLSWTTPGPLGIIFGTGLDWKSVILTLGILLSNSIIYLPSVMLYDKKILQGKIEFDKTIEDNNEPQSNVQDFNNKLKILIICAGGATSGALANKLINIGKEKNIEIEASGSAWGQHKDKLQNLDFVILAPQVSNQESVLKEQLKNQNILSDVLIFKGIDYINFSKNPEILLNILIKKKEVK